jgi:hypothetical protein
LGTGYWWEGGLRERLSRDGTVGRHEREGRAGSSEFFLGRLEGV